MKKALLLFCLLFVSISVSAEIVNFRTNAYCQKEKKKNGKWGEWSKWVSSNVDVVINTDKDIITIYSEPKVQIFYIKDYLGEVIDKDGEVTEKFSCVDQNKQKGQIRLVMRKTGRSELYVDMPKKRFVYDITQF